MSRLELSGVLSAVNAFAIHDNGHFAYLFDPRVNATIRIDIRNGTRDVLRWLVISIYDDECEKIPTPRLAVKLA
ncbi:unnamed protein product [Anisakis simplex]|uniref:Cadherin domain-containing protein n=1 Tax=Anisakis simplex TaxID=6269 RepID=A0A0M3JQ65_ANISI|nr:unnamed protein product [Anisakis simplex]